MGEISLIVIGDDLSQLDDTIAHLFGRCTGADHATNITDVVWRHMLCACLDRRQTNWRGWRLVWLVAAIIPNDLLDSLPKDCGPAIHHDRQF